MYIVEKIWKESAIEQNTASERILSRLMECLERQKEFPLHELYELSYAQFQLALELMWAWRLGRHCHSVPLGGSGHGIPAA